MTFKLWLGQSGLGRAFQSDKAGPRHVHGRLVGVSQRAIDIGITLPLETIRRWNREYSGAAAASQYSSVLIKVRNKDEVGDLIALAAEMQLYPKDTNARDVSVLLSGIMALLALVAAVILLVSASNIAYTFRVLVNDRRREIALYRAIGASARDMFKWLIGLALTVGVAGGAIGAAVAVALSFVADRLAATRLPDFPVQTRYVLRVSDMAARRRFGLCGAVRPRRRLRPRAPRRQGRSRRRSRRALESNSATLAARSCP